MGCGASSPAQASTVSQTTSAATSTAAPAAAAAAAAPAAAAAAPAAAAAAATSAAAPIAAAAKEKAAELLPPEVGKIVAIKTSHPENRMAKHFDPEYLKSLDASKQKQLLACCRSGLDNPDSAMGLYACQPDDYDTFKPYFDKVIRDYHGINKEVKHESNWDVSKVANMPEGGKLDVSKFGLGPLSMRVRVGRNLKEFPLPGSMSVDDRLKLEQKMIGAFKQLMEDPAYGGKYYSITPNIAESITTDEYNQLVADHIMFKDMSADPYLNSAGISSGWPNGRGCYVSEDKGFIVWVGEEDHLRIMCMAKGTVLNTVFERLNTCLAVMEKHAEFAFSPSYGAVTSCPTNLGTGMRASVHLPLPKLTKNGTDVSMAKAGAKTLGLSVRGAGGEHTEAGAGGIVDISPSARLCIQEAEIMAALYNGIQKLMDMEGGPSDAPSGDVPEAVTKIVAIKTSHPENRMAKHFDPEYYKSLYESKQAQLLACCRSGLDNPDSAMGLYACQPDDYDTFKPYFDKVIRDYHGINTEVKHVSNWDVSKVENMPEGGVLDLAKLGLGELSMRVRVGRNLKEFPLPGSMTVEDRLALEQKMIGAFKQLMEDPAYGGKYYSISKDIPESITTDEYNQLVADHIMFKDMSADPYLNSAGISSGWPNGRGCYVSEDKGFIVWVGEEDHLRIMCMAKGTVLNTVFERLNTCLGVMEKHAEFAFSPSYGAVTSCPTNLGTGMRASVHLPLPKLTKDGTDVSEAKAAAKGFGLSVRGAGGEHTEAGAGGIVDISPSARLCIQEAEIMAALYNGIKNLWELENGGAALAAAAPAGDLPEEVTKIVAIKTSHPENRMAKHFDPAYYSSLDDDGKTKLVQCCRSGLENPDSAMGLYACQPDDYDRFKPYFDAVIRDYHGINTEVKHVSNWDVSKVENMPEGGVLDLAALGLGELSMRVRVGRNLKEFPLPGSMTVEDRLALEQKMIGAFKQLMEDPAYGGKYHSISKDIPESITDEEYNQLVADHIMFKDMSADPYLNSAGISSGWPNGRGCYVSEDKGFIVWVGEEDHLRIMCMAKGTVLNTVFERLNTCLAVMEKHAEFAFSPAYGAVTSCPTNLGTGMRASVHLPLPKLTKDGTDVSEAKAAAKGFGLSVRGAGGEHTEAGAGGIVDISPSARLCIQEAEIMAALYNGIKNLWTLENAPPLPEEVTKIVAIKTSHPENRMAKHFDTSYYSSLDDDGKAKLVQCCRSGLENPDSAMGLYACQPDDYDRFKPYFDAVIRDYHGINTEVKHVSNWDVSKVANMPEGGVLDLAKLGLGELSMRVRVGRNLKEFPLPGSMTVEDRLALEQKMIGAFKQLMEDPAYGGKYYSISKDIPESITDEEYNQLVADHIMFKDMSADPYLNSAGISSGWPNGRGCYVSEDKGFIVWVGEEDHLRIMCMAKGTVLNTVFERLNTCLAVMEKHAEFAFSPAYGAVTSCPTNLGTGMRASVHLPLPKLTKDGTDVSEAKAAAKGFGLSVRGAGGEHTEAGAGGIVDISPSARLCIQEAEIMAALYNGIKNLWELENGGAAPAAAAPAGDLPEEVTKIVAIKTSHPENRMAKHFDPAYYSSLDDDGKTKLVQCCRSGLENPDSAMGLYACQPDDYDRFKPYFDAVIRDYHGINTEVQHVSNWDVSKVENMPEGGVLDLAALGLGELSMRVRVGRNLKEFPLPGSMTVEDRLALEQKMIGAFKQLMEDPAYGGKYHSISKDIPESITDEEYNQLVADHIMFKDMSADPYLNSAGISSGWPNGRGCYVSEDKGFIVWVGEEDHLRIMCMAKGTVLNTVFERLNTCLAVMEKHAEFAFSPAYGAVTSCPTNLGTGMRASVHLPLPKLTKDGTDVSEAKAAAKGFGLSVRGAGGEHTEAGAGGIVDISPSARLCIQEAEIMAALYNGIKNLWELENGGAAPAAAAPAGDLPEEVTKIVAIKTSHPENRMAKHFDPAYYSSLDDDGKAKLVQCCRSGLENPDSAMGLYACQPDDYDRFKPYFDAVIRDYHGIDTEVKHVSNWDVSKVENMPEGGVLDLAALGLGELSMRVRVGRNLKEFPLPGSMTVEDRLALEQKMIGAFKQLMEDPAYGGKYYSISKDIPESITDEEYNQLVADHIMFKDMSADPYLNSAGISSGWPNGRGCYVSEDKGFIVWVGEEDHLRIMCMAKGTVLNTVFERLNTCLGVMEKHAEFAFSPAYGAVTSCPTNLGTGMRASVHLPLPKLTKDGTDVSEAKTAAKGFGLSVRGAGGEHTEAGAGGIVDISPSARLCIQEAEIMAALYNGIKSLWELESA